MRGGGLLDPIRGGSDGAESDQANQEVVIEISDGSDDEEQYPLGSMMEKLKGIPSTDSKRDVMHSFELVRGVVRRIPDVTNAVVEAKNPDVEDLFVQCMSGLIEFEARLKRHSLLFAVVRRV